MGTEDPGRTALEGPPILFGGSARGPHVRAFIIRIGFWGPLYYTSIYEWNPQNSIGKYLGIPY